MLGGDRMTIEKKFKDPKTHIIGGLLNGLYYYYLDNDLIHTDGVDQSETLIGTTNAITNITFVPFLDMQDTYLNQIPFDSNRYGLKDDYSVFRYVNTAPPQPKKLLELKKYNIKRPDRIGLSHGYQYESKLQDFPYRTLVFTSNMFTKYEIKPHLMETKDTMVHLYSVTPITPSGSFQIYVDGYKEGSGEGAFLERQYINSSCDIPNTSSAYSNFMATQKAQTAVNLDAKLLNASIKPFMGLAGGLMGGGSLAGKALGASAGFAVGAFGASIEKKQAITQNLAMKQDLASTPNSLTSAGGDLLTRLGTQNGATVSGGSMSITHEYKTIIGDYFHMYGYKQNEIMNIDLESRYYFNYIKTVGANISTRLNGIPAQYLQELKNIFDGGITLWHVDREESKVNMYDYQYENIEMSILKGEL